MRYEPLDPIVPDELASALASNDTARIASGLLRAAFHGGSRDLFDVCADFLGHSDANVRSAAAQAIGMLARRDANAVAFDRAEQALAILLNDPERSVRGAASDALEEMGSAVPGWVPTGSAASMAIGGFAFDDDGRAEKFVAYVKDNALGTTSGPDHAQIVLVEIPAGWHDMRAWLDALAAAARRFDGEPYGWQLGD
jgi:HEAT repeat protein